MEKNKNILIGGLLAIVLVMAVGYAAFATQLTINGNATITSNWDVHFDTTKTELVNGVVVGTPGLSGATAPTGTIVYQDSSNNSSNLHAKLNAKLTQPGDTVVFTLTILNDGNLNAVLDSGPTLTLSGGTVSGLTATKGNITFTVTTPGSISAKNGNEPGSTTMTVTATFTEPGTGNYTTTESATLDVNFTYKQAPAQQG